MRTLSIATATAVALTMSVGCGSPDEPDGAVIIIMDDASNNSTATNVATDTTTATNGGTTNDTNPTNNTTTTTPDPTNNTTMTPDPTNNMTTEPDPQEPCGNGFVEDDETCDGNCPTRCDDGDPCTLGTLTGSAAMCSAVCEYQADPTCDQWEGTYSGSYFIKSEEKIGSSVINSMTCTGTFEIDVDMSRTDNLMGTGTCSYGGSLSGFDSTQPAAMTGKIAPDGSFTMRIHHESGAQLDGYFNVEGTLTGGTLHVDDVVGYKPHPMSAVPWETNVKLN